MGTVYRRFRSFRRKVTDWTQFVADFRKFSSLASQTRSRFDLSWDRRYPCLHDRTAVMGYDAHYVLHPAWAARVLAKTRPAEHIDISSTLVFSALVSAFTQVRHFDFREPRIALSQLETGRADLLQLPFADRSVLSLSCMHVVEHVGLGRYGDPLDYDGDLKAMLELDRVLAPGGDLLFVVPMSKPIIRFNAHRQYGFEQVCGVFENLKLKDFSLITDQGELVANASPTLVQSQEYGCGCFWFKK